ncbi:prepilin peptidase [Candidatus Saccharibacteria bacterium]|nr:prepilin peptidase [Candidatus Saccharibacteria bacterium]
MIRIMLIIFSALIGAAFGSFACCQAWRIRLKEENKKDPGKRSVCLNCGEKLAWYENIPVISWLLQRGRCRKCGKKIGVAEILAEIFGLVSFGLITWRFVGEVSSDIVGITEFLAALNIPGLVAALSVMVGMIILMVYDGKWQEMPVGILLYTIIMGLVYCGITICQNGLSWENLLQILICVGLLAGIYYLLYFLSKEKLVGGGDWMLCLAIGLMLGKWQLALIELFLANFLGAIVMLGLKKKKAAFGPFLVIAFVVVFVFENAIMRYLSF